MAEVKMDKYQEVAKQVAMEEDDDFEEFETQGKTKDEHHTPYHNNPRGGWLSLTKEKTDRGNEGIDHSITSRSSEGDGRRGEERGE